VIVGFVLVYSFGLLVAFGERVMILDQSFLMFLKPPAFCLASLIPLLSS